MKNNPIIEILMRRDNMSLEVAKEILQEARESLETYLDIGDTEAAENICMEYFGLEPDYIDYLL